MTTPDPDYAPHVRLAHADDDEFILSIAERLVGFELPAWRKRSETLAGIRADIDRHLRELPAASHLFVAEVEVGDIRPRASRGGRAEGAPGTASEEAIERVGFLHLQTQKDFFTGVLNCHIADLVVATEHDGEGVGSALVSFAEQWAREHRCRHVTLAVFPGNKRARFLYERHGYGDELIRMAKPVK
ncbi:MAG TPA: GNAT family N-acetyltransferase [Rudaea sp.]|jgi:ribosomal protein S18 acetylase RimI-like enzyme